MPLPPKLTDEQRRAALAKAAEARRARAELKEKLKMGSLTLKELLDQSASDEVVAKMKEMPTDDPLFGKGSVRADGRKIHPAYLFEVKKPEESKYPYDYYKLVSTIPADQAFRPIADGGCSLVK